LKRKIRPVKSSTRVGRSCLCRCGFNRLCLNLWIKIEMVEIPIQAMRLAYQQNRKYDST